MSKASTAFTFFRKAVSLLLLPVFLQSCANDVDKQITATSEELHDVVFHAVWDSETKTTLQDNGAIWWMPDDEIALFVNSVDKYCLRSNCEKPSPKTDFVGSIGECEERYYAISPYENATDWYSCFIIPSIQYSPAGSFSPSQMVSFASTNDDHLSFYNAFAGIRFSVVHEGVTKVVFKNRGDHEPITGRMEIPFPADFPESRTIVCGDSDVSNTLTVYPAEGKYFIPGEYYYASLRPYSTSLIISCYTETQVATIAKADRYFERSTVVTLSEIDKDHTYNNIENYTYSTLEPITSLLPDGIDKDAITTAVFHTNSSRKTEMIVPCSIPRYISSGYDYDTEYIPVYFEMIGSAAHFYTEADRYRMAGPYSINFFEWHELKSVDLSMFNTEQVTDFRNMFWGCYNLESVNLSSFETSNAQSFAMMFENCRKLKKLDISNFSSRSVRYNGAESPFTGFFSECFRLVSLDLGDFCLNEDVDGGMHRFACISHRCAIRCNSSTREVLCRQSSHLSNEQSITWVLPGEEMPDLEPYTFDYYSTDFSKDKTFQVLQKATIGNGLNIILLGDGYSDRMINDGTYDEDMIRAKDAIFKDEPYATFKDCFNVYAVYAVSENEIAGESNTALDAYIGGMDPINGPEASFLDYYLDQYIKIPDADISETCVVIILNQEAGFVAGVTHLGHYMEGSDLHDNTDYAKGGSVVMICRQLGDDYPYVVAHEFGHGFAKLGDEYCVYGGSMPDWEKDYYNEYSNKYGWWANLDFTNDPSVVKWSRFLNDERYIGTGIDVIEGGTYARGIWRPSQSSIMNNNRGMFNAPSREAIYKRIHRLAFGKEWQYDYETFVEYDQKNIAAEKAAQSVPKALQLPASELHMKPFKKIEKEVMPDGTERIRVIMN